MAPTLEQVFTIRAFLSKDILPVGPIKGGAQRMVVQITHGFLEGSGVKAEIVPGHSDWLLLDPAVGVVHLDVRISFKVPETGEAIYMQYPGIIRIDEATQKVLQFSPDAKSTKSKDGYFFTTPRIEASSERLKWMEQTVFISHGHWHVPGDGTQAVEYEVYKVLSG